MKLRFLPAVVVGLSLGGNDLAADGVSLSVGVDRPAHEISPRLYGIFLEDINFGGDGGLNAELVKNGSFEFPNSLMGWSMGVPQRVLDDDPAFASNPHYLRIESREEGSGGATAVNEGFRGIGVLAGERYSFTTQARSTVNDSPPLNVRLVSDRGTTLAHAQLKDVDGGWSEHSAVLVPTQTCAKARLELEVAGRGTVDVDLVSLSPENTWKQRPHGQRADLVQLLADLKPSFFRFPGGCIVEGSELKYRYQWKTTIGDRADRRLIINRWNYEFRHRPTPDYFQSFALGFYEYFLLAEDIGAAPLPILNCGMACQFNSGELVPVDELDPYIQDALDLIEFANGDTSTTWGAKRAALGHPEPFNLQLLGVGNEQWGPQYFERYEIFAKVLKERHPEIELVSGSGPFPADEHFHFAWPRLKALAADVVDEHCYAMPDWFLRSATRFDDYDRSGPKVFMGEYAAQSIDIVSPDNRNNLRCALAEAAFLTGIERNSDVVVMSSYAPLFGHEEAWQWRPNLIWFDNLTAYATPNYYVQQLFSQHRGDVVLPVELVDSRPPEPAMGRIGLVTGRASVEFNDVQVTRDGQVVFAPHALEDLKNLNTFWGRWDAHDGVIRQADPNAAARAHFGDYSWRNYTLSLKARKLGGRGGFGVIVRNSAGGSYLQWNIGGDRNVEHSLEAHLASHSVDDTTVDRAPGSIESDRWYDVKVEVSGSRVRCYLDGEPVHDLDIPPPNLPRLFATASLEHASGEVILKVVNPTEEKTEVDLTLSGVASLQSSAQAIVLAGDPEDENSINRPDNVVPVAGRVDVAQPRFRHGFAPHSLTILRFEVDAN